MTYFILKPPLQLLKKTTTQSGFKRYFGNTSWLFAQKAVQMFLALFVGVWVARYLGPEKLGMLSFATALVGLLNPLFALGLRGIVVREIVKYPDCQGQFVGTTMYLRVLSSSLLVGTTLIIVIFLKQDAIYIWMTFFVALGTVFQASEAYEFYFLARVQSKYPAIANILAHLISSAFRVILILAGGSLIYFAVANTLQGCLIAVLLAFIYIRKTHSAKLIFDSELARELLKESWPLIIGGFFALIYHQIDQLMISQMMSSYDLGQYSVALRISSVWFFIPMMIGRSVQPAIIKAKEQSESLYHNRLFILFSAMAIAGYFFVIPIALFSKQIIHTLYGAAYSEAGNVLAIHIFSLIFLFVGIPRGLWVSTDSHFKFVSISNIIAGVVNIVLNFLWIPKYGIIGGAWSTLASYFVTFVASGFFYPPAVRIAWMQILALSGLAPLQIALHRIRTKL